MVFEREETRTNARIMVDDVMLEQVNDVGLTFLKSPIPTDIKIELDSSLRESAPSFTTVKYWVAGFKHPHISCQDEHRSNQSNEVTTPETVKKIHKIILNDRSRFDSWYSKFRKRIFSVIYYGLGVWDRPQSSPVVYYPQHKRN
ncbi:hypothetical protein K1T71_002832 [Dendrolimus kikuchii]|uniref:Uncharacterized protein n=1 Tax=Dendrolimus kikuchii TaxID=765133 RepID=A0ACC1DE90_9NEOP|nr:hypothetical protein K1T71_002832 [Dendrolimus kikuchii]